MLHSIKSSEINYEFHFKIVMNFQLFDYFL